MVAAPAKQTRGATKYWLPKSWEINTILDCKVELSTNSSNSFSKREHLEDLGLPDLSFEWFTNMGLKQFNHIVERELVFFEFVDFNFLRHVKFSFVKN